MRARIGRLKTSFVPWELSLPTEVAHGHGQHAVHVYHYTNLTVVRPSVHPESITGSYLTPFKKLAFFASLSFDITEAIA